MSFAALVFWAASAIDGLLMRLSPKYKASRFYDDCKRMHMKDDPEFNAIIREILLTQYGYKVEP
jgi:hypothetical protein